MESKKPLKRLRRKQNQVLSKLSEMSRRDLDKLQRLKTNALITIEIHSRDVIDRLYKASSYFILIVFAKLLPILSNDFQIAEIRMHLNGFLSFVSIGIETRITALSNKQIHSLLMDTNIMETQEDS